MAAPFLTLPPEVLVMIMSFSESLDDLWSLIQASPAVLSWFSANRQRFLQPHIRSLKDSFGGDVPLSALLTVHLRYIRSRWPSGGSIENLQHYIKSVLQTLVPFGRGQTTLAYQDPDNFCPLGIGALGRLDYI
ncbi:hypothetical protein AUP68_15953 [Ilyonectria robusta]